MVFNFPWFFCCHDYLSYQERAALYFSVARKNKEAKMKEYKTAHLKRKQGHEIKKSRINGRTKAVSLPQIFSAYVLWLSDYRDTAFHRFCSLGPLPSTGHILNGTG